MRAKSFQTKVVLFLVIGLFFSFIVTVFSVSTYIYTLEKEELKRHLSLVGEDIIKQRLYQKGTLDNIDLLPLTHEYDGSRISGKIDQLHIIIKENELYEEKDRLFVSQKIDTNKFLILSSSTNKIKSGVYTLTIGVLLLVSIIMILFTLVFAWYVYTLLRPMKQLVHYCDDFSKEYQIEPPKGGSLEIEQLKDSIVKLLSENIALCSKERDIFKEAAHELKTPVAILKSRLALFNKKESFTKEKFIKEANEDIDLIVMRLRELLFLKTVEMDMHRQSKKIDILTQCFSLQNAFKPIVDKKRLTILPIRKGTFSLFSNEDALQKVLLSVFENIFIHAKNNSTIKVIIDGEKRLLEIQNEVALENDDKLFSSQIGTKIIERLSEILHYSYNSHMEEGIFVTRIYFEDV